jgi:phosphoglycolate phosphatase
LPHHDSSAPTTRPGTGTTRHIGDNGGVSAQLVIFDLDGTLTDSADGIVSSFRHALGEIGAAVPEGDLAGRIVGPPMHLTLKTLGLGDRVDDAMAAYRADYTTRGWAMNSVFEGIPALLNDLRAAGVRMAVATSKAEPTAKRIIEHFGLDDHFEVVAGASVDGSRSSKADVLARALAQLEPLPERVLMVGDRSHDVLGAAAHGIDTVVVAWGYGAGDFGGAEEAEPYRHVSSVADLREVLGV